MRVGVRVRVALTHEGEGLLVELHREGDAVLEHLRASRKGAGAARAARGCTGCTGSHRLYEVYAHR